MLLAFGREAIVMLETNEKLGHRIRELRKGRRISQERLAEMVDVSLTFMGKVERGRALPSLTTCKNLCLALEVTLPELFKFCGPDIGQPSAETDRVGYIVRRLQEAKPDQVEMIVCIIDAVLDSGKEKKKTE